MDLLRRAATEHPVASTIVIAVEVAAVLIVVAILTGRVIAPFGAIAAFLVGLAIWGWRKRHG
jgi:hypothetical protein